MSETMPCKTPVLILTSFADPGRWGKEYKVSEPWLCHLLAGQAVPRMGMRDEDTGPGHSDGGAVVRVALGIRFSRK